MVRDACLHYSEYAKDGSGNRRGGICPSFTLIFGCKRVNYRPISRGDNMFGSVRTFVCLFVQALCLNRLTYCCCFTGCTLVVDHAFNI